MERFNGKRVFITGCSQGIGLACVELFLSEGAMVHGIYSPLEPDAGRGETLIRTHRGCVTMQKADLGNAEQIAGMWNESIRHGGFDILILNAAHQRKASFDQTDRALLEQTFQVNVLGNFQLAKLFIDERRATCSPGAIVVHTSNQGEFVNPTGFAYGLSKAALNHFIRHTARAVVQDRIRVNGVILGWFDTDGERNFYSSAQIHEQAMTGIPMQRPGKPVEAARMAAFLASDGCSYMTGSLVRFDGGYSLAPDLST